MSVAASVLLATLLALTPASARAEAPAVDETHRARAELRRALHEEPQFVKVHAAEAMLELGLGADDVKRVFEQERRLHESQSPYRIGIWRVLARTASAPQERQAFIDPILASFRDAASPDAETAVEALAKLEYAVPEADRPGLRAWTEAVATDRRSYGRWLLAVAGDDRDVRRLAELLSDPHPMTRGAAAYGLRFMAKRLPPDVIEQLERAADKAGPQDSRAHLVGAAFATTTDPARLRRYRDLLIPLARGGTKAEKYEALNAFADRGAAGDVPLVVELLGDAEPDVRVSAARALLMIDRRLRLANR
jgi:solute:Na+ symporter, SSS family